jgi:putative proteasome-type protease
MTFCLGMRVGEGLVGIADTCVTSGTEVITARKVSVHEHGGHPFFLMTSGLRSVRDKTLIYFEEVLEGADAEFDKLYKAVNAFSKQLRRVSDEDKEALAQGSYRFDLHALIGGQFRHDKEHKLYLIYPQGNWVEVGAGTPYCIIGESGYGKPILDRTLEFNDSIRYALKVGCLAFDSTRISAANVDFPIDVIVYDAERHSILEHRYEKHDLLEISNWWQERLRQSVIDLPQQWQEAVLGPESVLHERTIRLPTGSSAHGT